MENPLQEYMREEEITPSELSDKLMVSLSTVYSWIRGDTAPSIGNMRNLARKMGMKSSVLKWKWRKWENEQNDATSCTEDSHSIGENEKKEEKDEMPEVQKESNES